MPDVRRLTRSAWGGRLSTAVARLNARHPWSHNDHFHGWILSRLPTQRRRALDVGCGRGELLAALASSCDEVVGIDTDADMRAAASAFRRSGTTSASGTRSSGRLAETCRRAAAGHERAERGCAPVA